MPKPKELSETRSDRLRVFEVDHSQVKLIFRMPEQAHKNVLCYLSIEFKNTLFRIVVHDVRLVTNLENEYILAMPSLQKTMRCKKCQKKVPNNVKYCSSCGAFVFVEGSHMERFDTAHPLDMETREYLDSIVVDGYEQVLQLMK